MTLGKKVRAAPRDIGVKSDSRYWQVTGSFGEPGFDCASWSIQSGMKTKFCCSSFGEGGQERR